MQPPAHHALQTQQAQPAQGRPNAQAAGSAAASRARRAAAWLVQLQAAPAPARPPAALRAPAGGHCRSQLQPAGELASRQPGRAASAVASLPWPHPLHRLLLRQPPLRGCRLHCLALQPCSAGRWQAQATSTPPRCRTLWQTRCQPHVARPVVGQRKQAVRPPALALLCWQLPGCGRNRSTASHTTLRTAPHMSLRFDLRCTGSH